MERKAGFWAAAMAGVTAAIAGCASEPPQPVVRDAMQTVSATVVAIKPADRLLQLKGPTRTLFIEVGPEVRNFDNIHVGDKVNVSYYEAIAAQLAKKGASGAPQEAVSTYTAPEGARPAGAVGHSISTTVNIQSVDTSFNTVTFKRDDGTVHTVAINSPQGQKFIRTLKPGDNVDVVYTEAVAVTVTPAS